MMKRHNIYASIILKNRLKWKGIEEYLLLHIKTIFLVSLNFTGIFLNTLFKEQDTVYEK